MSLRCLIILISAILGAVLSRPALAQEDDALTVAVAANLLPPMQQIKALFEKAYSTADLLLVSASSGKLTAQILNGAPYDVFIAADMQYPEKIYKAGHAQNRPDVLVRGKLVFWSKQKITKGTIGSVLSSPGIRSVALAQPELAPYGQQASMWLKEQQLYEQLSSRVVFGENIGQVNQYIKSGAVDAAFTAVSAMHAAELKNTGFWYPVAVKADNSNLNHGIVLLTNAESDPKTINLFLEFINSPVAGDVFLEFGYDLP